MGFRLDRVTIEGVVEFAGATAIVVEPTFAQQDDPRVLAFLQWASEINLAKVRLASLADPDRGIPFL